MHDAGFNLKLHRAARHHARRMHRAVGQDRHRAAFQVRKAADRVSGRAVVGQARIHEERVFLLAEEPRRHALDVAHALPVDRATDHGIDRILGALGHAGDRLERAGGVVLVPGADLLLGHVGEAQQLARRGHEPRHRSRRLLERDVLDVEPVEEVRRPQRQIARDVAAGLPVVCELADVAAACGAVEHVGIHDHRLRVAGADVGLRTHGHAAGRDRVRIHRGHPPLGRPSQQHQRVER